MKSLKDERGFSVLFGGFFGFFGGGAGVCFWFCFTFSVWAPRKKRGTLIQISVMGNNGNQRATRGRKKWWNAGQVGARPKDGQMDGWMGGWTSGWVGG